MNELELMKANRLEKLRKELGLTNTRFADLLQVSESQVRNYQKCRQPIPDDVIDRISNGNSLLRNWLLCNADYKSVSDIITASASIVKNFSEDELKWQETIAYLLCRNGYTQADIGFDCYIDFLEYIDKHIKYGIQTYLRYFKE